MSAQSNRELITKCFLSLITILYFSFVLFWIFPDRDKRYQYLSAVIPWMRFWNLDQHWGFFATFDKKTNSHLIGEATFNSGFKLIVEPPQRDSLSLPESVRYQKMAYLFSDYLGDRLFRDEDSTRFLLRPYNNSSNPPRSFLLSKIEVVTPPPGSAPENEKLMEKPRFSQLFNIDLNSN